MDYAELDELFAGELRGKETFDADGMGDGHVQMAEDGCELEPDAVCPHGFPSPERRLLVI